MNPKKLIRRTKRHLPLLASALFLIAVGVGVVLMNGVNL